MKVGILGAGNIAAVMAGTIARMDGVTCAAVAARDPARAQAFAGRFGIGRAYGSYEALAADGDLDLIYIATPHSHHYAHMKLCLDHGRNVLCEKAFTADAAQAEDILAYGRSRGCLVAEAIWTRYLPSRALIRDVIDSGMLGQVTSLTASLGYPLLGVERLREPSLAGGALLDLGVYPINFALMAFGGEVGSVASSAVFLDTGVDAAESITLTWKDGRIASLFSEIRAQTDNRAVIYGDKGYAEIDKIENCRALRIYDTDRRPVKEIPIPPQISGYEYEVLACRRAIAEGKSECEEMPHRETLYVMRLMDQVRECWGKR